MKKILNAFLILFSFLIVLGFYLNNKFNFYSMYKTQGKENAKILIGKLPFSIENNRAFVQSDINEKSNKLLFDTGASFTILFDSIDFIKNEQTNKRLQIASKITTPDGGKITSKMGLVKFKNAIISGNPFFAMNIKKGKFLCVPFTGIFSLSNFLDEEKIIKLNFIDNNIEVLNQIDKTFTEIPFKVELSGIPLIEIIINNEITWVTFDTGFDGNITTNKSYVASEKLVYETFENQTFQKNKDSTKKEMVLQTEINIEISGQKFQTDAVQNPFFKSSFPNLGLNFIKNFNWIFDFKNEKAYFKNINSLKYIKSALIVNYYSGQKNNLLYILLKEKSQTKYNLNDQITSVNNQKVTPENICEMQDFLNKTEDWNTLNLEVIPAVK